MNKKSFMFRLYVAGETRNSLQAVANLRAICHEHIPDQYDVEIVDVLREPQRALDDCIFMTPTLVKLYPTPTQKIVGTLSQRQPLLQALGLEAAA